jgi:predicted amino acid racemase
MQHANASRAIAEPSLLAKALERNPAMLEAAIRLHQDGAIPPSTHLVDLDAVAHNASAIAEAARRSGLTAFAMTKQDGHEPHMTGVILDRGFDGVTAVEAMQAYRIHRHGFPLGNVGHTSQLPRAEVQRILAMDPRFVTVYTAEAARRVSEACVALDRTQPLYVTVGRPGEEGTEAELFGGWDEEGCVEGIRPILNLPNVQVAGIAQHITIDYPSQDAPSTARPTEAFFTALRARERLERDLGLYELRINCSGNCNAVTAGILASYGATDIEPGAALVGSGRFHALLDMPEIPAQVFVSEITHHWAGNAYAIGGGFGFVWDMDGALAPFQGIVGRSLEQARAQPLDFRGPPWYDVYGLFGDPDGIAGVGDTLLFTHLPQVIMERCYVAAVSGTSTQRPIVEALLDSEGTVLDENRNPLTLEEARASVDRVRQKYRKQMKVASES